MKNNMNSLYTLALAEIAELYFFNDGAELDNELDQLLDEAGLPINIDREKSSREAVYINMLVDDKNKKFVLYPNFI